jgi:transcriptional regulator with XRE-family HTH domain
MKKKAETILPIPVKRALHKLGADIRMARLRRRIPMVLMAERVSVSRTTLSKVENGDPSVSMGVYTTVLFVLGLTERLSVLCDAKYDSIGMSLEEERLPKRIRSPKSGSKERLS